MPGGLLVVAEMKALMESLRKTDLGLTWYTFKPSAGKVQLEGQIEAVKQQPPAEPPPAGG